MLYFHTKEMFFFFFTTLGFKISRAVNEKRSFVEILSFVKEKNSSAYYDNSQYVLQTSNITNKHPRKSFVFLIIQRIYLLHPNVKNLCFILLFMHFQVQPIFQIFSTKIVLLVPYVLRLLLYIVILYIYPWLIKSFYLKNKEVRKFLNAFLLFHYCTPFVPKCLF